MPLRPRLFRRLVSAAVAAAGQHVSITVKLRMGLSSELLTYLQVRCSQGTSQGQLIITVSRLCHSPVDGTVLAALILQLTCCYCRD